MKKFFAMLLILVMALPCTLAVADGAMTDKPISFAEFAFGDTFGNIRKNIKSNSIDFKYGAYTSRYMADAIDSLPYYNYSAEESIMCFMLRERGRRQVAGHEADVCMWFAYPATSNTDDNNAIFYAGEYEFDVQDDPDGVFADLKNKLSQVYGDPFYAGNDISAVMGEPGVEDMERYNNDIALYQPEFAVWKSSVDNSAVVLKNFNQYGDWMRVKLCYISDVADETFAQLSAMTPEATVNDSLDGL